MTAPSEREVSGTCESLVFEPGRRVRLNFFWEPMAAGKGGAENMAATMLMRVIQDCICSALLGVKGRRRSNRGQKNDRIQKVIYI